MRIKKTILGLGLGLTVLVVLAYLASLEIKSRHHKSSIEIPSGKAPAVEETKTYTNRLIHEKSPYLLQHAHNPVDWYPWGEEAFEKARKENKPIFLSIGYSTCHWCHVMEEESFSNPEIAKIMNEHFVSIKVDREERPDIDKIYMQTVIAMTGSGGWPLTVFLTPDLKPFFGGTYYPPEDKLGLPGLVTIFNAINKAWKTDHAEILKSSEEISKIISSLSLQKSGTQQPLDKQTLAIAYQQLRSRFDSAHGGFDHAPKFPRGHTLSLLLRYWKRTQDPQALAMVEKTLQEMAKGGMYDHLGCGFHRYSTDPAWRVPHFEKMLYDQAMLSKTYLEAYQATGKKEYAQVARDIFDYVLREMTSSEGGFYSAEDADSAGDPSRPREKSEGAFYLWQDKEIEKTLGKEKAEIFNYFYGVEPQGNATRDPFGEFENKNILYIAHSIDETVKKFGKSAEEIQSILKESRRILFNIRSKRPRPHLDDKILTDWNGLMISSLAFGSRVLDEPRYREAAEKAADFLLAKMKREDGRLMHRYREGEAAITGYLDDYAFFSQGLYDLYEAAFNPVYLKEAQFFLKEMHQLFWDEKEGGLFLAGRDSEKLIMRPKELYDGSIPSGNSIAALSLLKVGRLTMDQEMEGWARSILEAFSGKIIQFPSEYPQMLIALDFALGPTREIVIAGEEEDPATQEMIKILYAQFLPNKIVAFNPSGNEKAKTMIGELSPFVKNQTEIGGKTTAYVCKNYVCDLPTTEISKFKELIEK